MEVTRKNFKEVFPLVKKSIESADFLAIDGEFTGLMSGRDVSAFDSPDAYYKRMLDGTSNFLLVQYGLVAFVWDPDTNSYMNEAYTFYLFPRTRPGPDRVFLSQNSSLEFLASNGFDFNKLFLEGISYLSEPAETALRERLQEKQKNQSNNRESIIAIPTENKPHVDEICDRIAKFVSESEPESIEIDRCNGFIRKLVFQEAALRFKDTAYVETKILENMDRVLKVTRISSTDAVDREEEKRQREWDELEEAVGFTKVVRLISESEKLVIGHNMLLDVMHTINQFYQPLPEDYASFKEFTHCMFPKLLDTKYMSSLPPFKDKLMSSMLSHLVSALSEKPFSMPDTGCVEGRGYSSSDAKHHEAGYDAFATGLCLIAMHGHLASMRGETAPESHRVTPEAPSLKPFLNKIYLFKTAHQDSPYMNLVGKDAEPSRDHVFFITFPKEWSRNDIVQLFSPFGPILVQFLDETSAMVGLTRRDQARAAARSLAANSPKGAIVRPYAHYRSVYNKCAGAKQALWLRKERLEEYSKRAQVISNAKPTPPQPSLATEQENPEAANPEDPASTTTSADFIPFRSQPTSAAGKTSSGRKRTSSGVFVIDVKSPVEKAEVGKPEPRQTRRDTKRERKGKKHQIYEEPVIIPKKKKVASPERETTLEKSDVESGMGAERVNAFQESDNWE